MGIPLLDSGKDNVLKHMFYVEPSAALDLGLLLPDLIIQDILKMPLFLHSKAFFSVSLPQLVLEDFSTKFF